MVFDRCFLVGEGRVLVPSGATAQDGERGERASRCTASSMSAGSLAPRAGVANLRAVGHLISVVRAGVGAGAALRKKTRSGAVGRRTRGKR